ncbi:hypothetical protein AB0I22_22515 [Streptomyces sp. NPDC050610]|uniref:hypothetical protein n=1 Tax=Streptomyces sp. NPDC050610 TaxID=3157097 RepID=UPI0034135AFE
MPPRTAPTGPPVSARGPGARSPEPGALQGFTTRRYGLGATSHAYAIAAALLALAALEALAASRRGAVRAETDHSR